MLTELSNSVVSGKVSDSLMYKKSCPRKKDETV